MRNIKTYRKDFTPDEREAYKAYRRGVYKNESKETREARAAKTRARRDDGYYTVYYLPNEHYVGYTKMLKERISGHKLKGRDTSEYRILKTFTDKHFARLYEAQWHTMGVNGFSGW